MPCAGQSCPHPEGKGDLSCSTFLPPAVKSCWDGKAMLEKTQRVWESREKVIPGMFSVCSPPLQPLPTLSAALYFPIRSIRDPRPFCIFPLWFLLLLDQDLGAQAGYKKQFKPVRFFIHVTKLFRAGRGRGGNAQNKRNYNKILDKLQTRAVGLDWAGCEDPTY